MREADLPRLSLRSEEAGTVTEETDGVEFPVPHDIEYVEGVRMERRPVWDKGRIVGHCWACPHGVVFGPDAGDGAAQCLIEHDDHPTDVGYTYSDPKHPAYHSTHSDWWDNRDKLNERS
jgi:hypothetical protein